MDLKTWNDALVAVFRLQSDTVLKARKLKKILGKNPHRIASEQLSTTIKYAWNGSLKIRTLRNCSLWCDKCASNCVTFYLLYGIMFMVELLIAFLTLPIVGVAALYDWFFNDPSRKTKFKKWEMKTKGERTTLSLDARHSQIESGMRALAKNLHRKMETKRLLICYKAGTKTKYRKETVDDNLSLVHNIIDTHFMIIFSTRKKRVAAISIPRNRLIGFMNLTQLFASSGKEWAIIFIFVIISSYTPRIFVAYYINFKGRPA
mmetsp:Transcript_45860/g.76422  ORF Transcript_45860/g.76422 Transcript_45860/m.76422 type:complete len:261 (-) Transcript_45860:271-1053(-)